MSPVATEPSVPRAPVQKFQTQAAHQNPFGFYNPAGKEDKDVSYKYANLKARGCTAKIRRKSYSLQPHFPEVDWEPLQEFQVADRGLFANPEKKALLGAATKVITLTPNIGTVLEGIDLRQLSNAQKDEL